jgi:hypothetical protein
VLLQICILKRFIPSSVTFFSFDIKSNERHKEARIFSRKDSGCQSSVSKNWPILPSLRTRRKKKMQHYNEPCNEDKGRALTACKIENKKMASSSSSHMHAHSQAHVHYSHTQVHTRALTPLMHAQHSHHTCTHAHTQSKCSGSWDGVGHLADKFK